MHLISIHKLVVRLGIHDVAIHSYIKTTLQHYWKCHEEHKHHTQNEKRVIIVIGHNNSIVYSIDFIPERDQFN